MTARRLVLLLALLGIVTISLVPPAFAKTTNAPSPGDNAVGICGSTPADYVGTYRGAFRNDDKPKEAVYFLTLTFTQQLQQHGNPIYEYTFQTADKGGNRSDPPPGVNYKDKIQVDRSHRTLRRILVTFELADPLGSSSGVSSSRTKSLAAVGCAAGSTIPERLQYTFPVLIAGLPTGHLILDRQ